MRLFVHLTGCRKTLNKVVASGIPLIVSVLASETVRPNAAHTVMHDYHLPELPRRLGDNSDIVSIYHTPW